MPRPTSRFLRKLFASINPRWFGNWMGYVTFTFTKWSVMRIFASFILLWDPVNVRARMHTPRNTNELLIAPGISSISQRNVLLSPPLSFFLSDGRRVIEVYWEIYVAWLSDFERFRHKKTSSSLIYKSNNTEKTARAGGFCFSERKCFACWRKINYPDASVMYIRGFINMKTKNLHVYIRAFLLFQAHRWNFMRARGMRTQRTKKKNLYSQYFYNECWHYDARAEKAAKIKIPISASHKEQSTVGSLSFAAFCTDFYIKNFIMSRSFSQRKISRKQIFFDFARQ